MSYAVKTGWFKIHRELIDELPAKLIGTYVYFEKLANYKTTVVRENGAAIPLLPGGCVCSLRKAAISLGLARSTLRGYLEDLKRRGLIRTVNTAKEGTIVYLSRQKEDPKPKMSNAPYRPRGSIYAPPKEGLKYRSINTKTSYRENEWRGLGCMGSEETKAYLRERELVIPSRIPFEALALLKAWKR